MSLFRKGKKKPLPVLIRREIRSGGFAEMEPSVPTTEKRKRVPAPFPEEGSRSPENVQKKRNAGSSWAI